MFPMSDGDPTAPRKGRPFTAFRRYLDLVGDQGDLASPPEPEEERGDYESGVVRLGSAVWRLRTARVTPTKPGAFVAVWRRDDQGETRPFRCDESTAGLLVFVQDRTRFGVFRFTSAHLADLGVTQSPAHPGKRGFRVYPAWCTGINPQAERTQRAQASAFTELGSQPGPVR